MTVPSSDRSEMELERLKSLCQAKDEEIEKGRTIISSLRRELFQHSQPSNPDLAALNLQQFDNLERENTLLEQENVELKCRYLTLLSHKNEYKKRYAKLKSIACVPCPPSPYSLEAENQSLRQKVVELTQTVAWVTEEKEFANEQLQERASIMKAMRTEAMEKFNILKSKLSEERGHFSETEVHDTIRELTQKYERELDELRNRLRESQAQSQSENTKLMETIDSLEKSAQESTAIQIDFIGSLETMLGCSSLAEALLKVQDLVKQKTGDSRAFGELIEAFKEILANLSPNALDLPSDSELRQLFAALCNMLTVAIDPLVTKSLLTPHVRAVVFQARSLTPKK
jgi:hypothetical protein